MAIFCSQRTVINNVTLSDIYGTTLFMNRHWVEKNDTLMPAPNMQLKSRVLLFTYNAYNGWPNDAHSAHRWAAASILFLASPENRDLVSRFPGILRIGWADSYDVGFILKLNVYTFMAIEGPHIEAV